MNFYRHTPLTAREREVVRLYCEEETTKGIALIMGVTAKTIEYYRKQVMYKLGTDNLVGLLKRAIRLGIFTLEEDYRVQQFPNYQEPKPELDTPPTPAKNSRR